MHFTLQIRTMFGSYVDFLNQEGILKIQNALKIRFPLVKIILTKLCCLNYLKIILLNPVRHLTHSSYAFEIGGSSGLKLAHLSKFHFKTHPSESFSSFKQPVRKNWCEPARVITAYTPFQL